MESYYPQSNLRIHRTAWRNRIPSSTPSQAEKVVSTPAEPLSMLPFTKSFTQCIYKSQAAIEEKPGQSKRI